jgi:hypothetical protein
VHPFVDCGTAAILAVVRDADGLVFAREFDTSAEVPVESATDDRAKLIAGLHEFANWLEANPWAPIARTSGYLANVRFQVDLHGPGEIGADADVATVDGVRRIADQLGVKADEHLDDRTDVSIEIGSVSYSVIAWHKKGRPAERDAELERLRAENARLQAQVVQHYHSGGWTTGNAPGSCGAQCACGVTFDGFDTYAEAVEMVQQHIADPDGQSFTRADSEPDDPKPVSPARAPLHVGVMDDGGLVDVTAVEPVHYRFGMNPTVCGLKPGMVPKASADRRDVTCLDCLDGMPF